MNQIIDNYLDQLNEVVSLMAVGIAFSAANAIVGATNVYKKNFTKAARRCKDLPDREKAVCMLRAKMLSKNIQLQALKSNMAKCEKTKNPNKCKEKMAIKMQKISNDIKFLAKRFQELRSQKYS